MTWFPPLLKSHNHVVCPKCRQQKPDGEMIFPYDEFWLRPEDQEKWCTDCVSDAAEEQDQRKFEQFHGG